MKKEGYIATPAEELKMACWRYCPYCLEGDGETASPNESGIEGNRFAWYLGDGMYKCQWCGRIFKEEEK